MSNKWKAPNVDPSEVDDFIIEADSDEETPLGRSQVPSGAPPIPPTGNIQSDTGSNSAGASNFFNFSNFVNPKVDLSSSFQPLGGNLEVRENEYSGGDTLDEPVLDTLLRDLKSIYIRCKAVVWPASLSKLAKVQQNNLLVYARNAGINVPDSLNQEVPADIEESSTPYNPESKALEWDLWGPLIFSLAYSVILGLSSPKTSSSEVFSGLFSLIWITFAIIGVNINLLGGTISIFSAISASGYSMFPIVIGAVISIFVKQALIRLIVDTIFCAWSIYAATVALKCSGVLPGRVFLAMYPVGLVYAILGWLCVIT